MEAHGRLRSVLRAVKRTLANGLAALHQRVLCDWHTASHANVKKCIDSDGDFVEK
jgi:hypothetical protein